MCIRKLPWSVTEAAVGFKKRQRNGIDDRGLYAILFQICSQLIATGMLLAGGLGLGGLLQTIKVPIVMRVCGGVVALGAIALWITAS